MLNPYDMTITPCGSSSGSAAAAALGFAPLTVGTETDGSITSPADRQGIVGMKPTLGLVSRTGILPIAPSQDTPGPMTRTVADAAALLDALVGHGVSSPPPADALDGVRLAVPPLPEDLHADDRELFQAAVQVMRDLGATAVEVPAMPETDETPVLHYEFARDVDAYLARLPPGAPVRTMAELAAWNDAHADEALKYGQAHVLAALEVDHDADLAAYRANRARDLAVAGEHGIDATLLAAGAAAVVTPGWHGAGQAARAGYPSITVPGGYRRSGRQPFGVTLVGPSGAEALLLGLGYAYEQASRARGPVSRVNPSLLR